MKILITFNFRLLPSKKIIVEAPSLSALSRRIVGVAQKYLTRSQNNSIEEAEMEEYKPSEVSKSNSFDWL